MFFKLSNKTGITLTLLAVLALAGCRAETLNQAETVGQDERNEMKETVMVSTLAGKDEGGFVYGESPFGITIDRAGNLYVTIDDDIYKVTPKGAVSLFAGSGEKTNMLYHPRGITIDAAGNLYMTNANSRRIHKITPAGEISTLAGGRFGEYRFADGKGENARFVHPRGITIDTAGNLYVTDSHRIRKVSPEGEVTTLAGGGSTNLEKGSFADGRGSAARFNNPFGIAIDAAGNLYVTDSGNERIRKVTPEGEVSTIAGGLNKLGLGDFADGEGQNARFFLPHGITIDAAGNLYVADFGNHRIRKVSPEGKVSTLAGSGPTADIYNGDFVDGEGSIARFSRPFGITIDAAGNLYVTEEWKNRIRKITIQRP